MLMCTHCWRRKDTYFTVIKIGSYYYYLCKKCMNIPFVKEGIESGKYKLIGKGDSIV